MNRFIIPITLVLGLSAGSAIADEKTKVYKSKGASGENAYTQLEVDGARAQTVDGRRRQQAAEKPTAVEKTEMELACERGKENLQLLESSKPLQHDKDGDGEMQDLTPEERLLEIDQSKRQITAYCVPEEGE